jgi:hypothetical protein
MVISLKLRRLVFSIARILPFFAKLFLEKKTISLLICYYFSGFNGYGGYFQQQQPPQTNSRHKGGFQQKFNPNRLDVIGRSMLYLKV